jgi:peptide chain release factor 1
MTAVPAEKLDKLIQRWETIQAELNQGVNQATRIQLSKEFAELNPVVATIQALRKAEAERDDLAALIDDPASDKDLAALAREEIAGLEQRMADLEQELRLHLLPKDAADEKSAILEVRAGTGGDEAALFAADVFRMYSRYAELHGWKTEIISISENDLGGLQGDRGDDLRARGVCPPQVRVGRAPRAACSRHGSERAHSHLGRHRCGVAGGGGYRPGDPPRGHPHRYHARRRRRPARQQDRFGGAHHPSADRTHRRLGREIAASEPPPGHAVLRSRLYEQERQSGRFAGRNARGRSVLAIARNRTYNFPQGRASPITASARRCTNSTRCSRAPRSTSWIDALVTEHQASELATMQEGAHA